MAVETVRVEVRLTPAPDGTAASWTPGPWRIMELPPREVLLKRRHWAVGQVNAPARGVGLAFGETDANARLIAAAPTQDAALNYVADMTYCKADGEWHFKKGYDPQIVLDALALARVETK